MKLPLFHKIVLAGLLLCMMMSSAMAADPVSSDIPNTENSVAERKMDPLAGADEKVIRQFCLVKGGTYRKVSACLTSLNADVSGLDAIKRPYYLRIDKELTDHYFRHVRAFDRETKEQLGDYYVSKDGKSVWRLDGKAPGLIAGSAEKVMKKSRLLVYPRYLQMGERGVVRLQTPGHVPYKLSVKSLNENVIRVEADNQLVPVALGKSNLLIEAEVGNVKDSGAAKVAVVTKEELQKMAYAFYVRQMTLNRLMMEEMYWDRWWGAPYSYPYYFHHSHHHPRGHRPPPPPPRHK
jgi:hypothetical protein